MYSLEAPHWASLYKCLTEALQKSAHNMFSWKNKEIINSFLLKNKKRKVSYLEPWILLPPH